MSCQKFFCQARRNNWAISVDTDRLLQHSLANTESGGGRTGVDLAGTTGQARRGETQRELSESKKSGKAC